MEQLADQVEEPSPTRRMEPTQDTLVEGDHNHRTAGGIEPIDPARVVVKQHQEMALHESSTTTAQEPPPLSDYPLERQTASILDESTTTSSSCCFSGLDDEEEEAASSVCWSQAETELHDNRQPRLPKPHVNLRVLAHQPQQLSSPQHPSAAASSSQTTTPYVSPYSHLHRSPSHVRSYVGVSSHTNNNHHHSLAASPHSNLQHANNNNHHHHHLPPLFASTKPKPPPSNPCSSRQPYPHAAIMPVPSPPMVARVSHVVPSTTTTTTTTTLVPSSTPSEPNKHDNNDDDTKRDHPHDPSPTVDPPSQPKLEPSLVLDQETRLVREDPAAATADPIEWEEEATPAQTAFAKQLLLARRPPRVGLRTSSTETTTPLEDHPPNTTNTNTTNESSESILSTASELGTVIQMEQRMAELDEDEAFLRMQDSTRENDPLQHDVSSPMANGNDKSAAEHPEPKQDDDDDTTKNDDDKDNADTSGRNEQERLGVPLPLVSTLSELRRENLKALQEFHQSSSSSFHEHHTTASDNEEDDDKEDHREEDEQSLAHLGLPLPLPLLPSSSFRRSEAMIRGSVHRMDDDDHEEEEEEEDLLSETVLSTASEMGTVINATAQLDRLAELDDDRDFYQEHNNNNNNEQQHTEPATTGFRLSPRRFRRSNLPGELNPLVGSDNAQHPPDHETHDDDDEAVTQLRHRPALYYQDERSKENDSGAMDKDQQHPTTTPLYPQVQKELLFSTPKDDPTGLLAQPEPTQQMNDDEEDEMHFGNRGESGPDDTVRVDKQNDVIQQDTVRSRNNVEDNSSPRLLSTKQRLSLAVRKTMAAKKHQQQQQQDGEHGTVGQRLLRRQQEHQQERRFSSSIGGHHHHLFKEQDRASHASVPPPTDSSPVTPRLGSKNKSSLQPRPIIPQAFSWSEGEGIEVTLSPVFGTPAKDNHDGWAGGTAQSSFQPGYESDSNVGNQSAHSQHPPVSFLLRSPGSTAYLAASSQKKKKKRNHGRRSIRAIWNERKGHGPSHDDSSSVYRSSSSRTEGEEKSASSLVQLIVVQEPVEKASPNRQNVEDTLPTEDENGKEQSETDRVLISPMRIPRSCFSFDEGQSVGSSFLRRRGQLSSSRPTPIKTWGRSKSKHEWSASSQAGSTQVSLGAEAMVGTTSLSWDLMSSTTTEQRAADVVGAGKSSFQSALDSSHRWPRDDSGTNRSRNSNYWSIFAERPGFVNPSVSSSSRRINNAAATVNGDVGEQPLHDTSSQMAAANVSQDRSFKRTLGFGKNNGHGTDQPPLAPNDFSPLMLNPNNGMAEELKTPQRIEIEREDAIDILACLVERGVSLHQSVAPLTPYPASSPDQIAPDSTVESTDVTPPTTNLSVKTVEDSASVPPPSISQGFDQTDAIGPIVQDLKALAETEENSDKRAASLHLIDELVKSHVYALEMSRAAQSACSWLKSIGRQHDSPGGTATADDEEDGSEKKRDDFVERDHRNRWRHKVQLQQIPEMMESSSSSPRSIDLLTTKARLHAAEDKLAGNAIQLQQLNEELANCRAEIGRLKSEKQVAIAAAFQPPNRSILDESEDVSLGEDVVNENDADQDPAVDQSFPSNPLFDEDRNGDMLIMYRKALEEANSVIEKLHSTLKTGTDSGSTGEHDTSERAVPENPPFVFVNENQFNNQGESKTQGERNERMGEHSTDKQRLSPGNKDEDTIHVHMLDSENFVTDWDDLSPLPPPPDHTLRSPMVQAVLESWTEDQGLHESMLSWMDQVLTNHADPQSIPPLTISNLDHQVKDGFILHVLPLLLRRKDILLNVKSRAHRRTTYDIAVSVDRPSLPGDFDMRRHLETIAARSDVGCGPNSVTHSTSTTLMGNGGARAFVMNATAGTDTNEGTSLVDHTNIHVTPKAQQHLMYDEMAEDMEEHVPNTGLMSALGGALGGFLTRNRGAFLTPSNATEDLDSPYDHHHHLLSSASMANTYTPHVTQPQMATPPSAAAELDEDQPYHRVVSAPAGRIGVTFVEFRGHAMVSDVAPDSPLHDWIFPSDILIAIDELPVSGMRVRDIIQVLKDRSDRQRALRIISCHAMNEIAVLHHSTSGIHGVSSQEGES